MWFILFNILRGVGLKWKSLYTLCNHSTSGTCPSSSQQMLTSMLSWLCSGISGSQLWMIWSFIFETIFPSSISNGYLGNLVMMLGPQVFSDNLCLINAQFSSGDRSSRRTGTDCVLTSCHPRRWDRSWVLLVLPHRQLSVIWSPWTYSLLGTELNTLFPIPDAFSLWSGPVKCGVFKWKP